MTTPSQPTPLVLALNHMPDRPTDTTNRSEYGTLVITQQQLGEFVKNVELLKDNAGYLTVLKPAMSKLNSITSLLGDHFIAYPINAPTKHPIELRFSALLPKASMTFLASHAVTLGATIQSDNTDYNTAINEVSSFLSALDNFDDTTVESAIREIDRLRNNDGKYRVSVGDNIDERLKSQLWDRYKSILGNLETQQSKMTSELSKLEDIRRAAEKAATESGKRRLKRDFGSVGNRETLWAALWTVFAFILTVGAIATPVVLFTKDVKFASETGLSVTLIKTFIGLPLLAFAAYCGRVASQHRDVARHLNLLVSQIDSVGAFVANLPEGAREEIQVILGKRAFSDPATSNDVNRAELGLGAGELALALSKALDVIDKLGGKPR